MGTDYAGGFPADGEGPVRKMRLSPFAIDAFPVTNSDFATFIRCTNYRTEAELFGWSVSGSSIGIPEKVDVVQLRAALNSLFDDLKVAGLSSEATRSAQTSAGNALNAVTDKKVTSDVVERNANEIGETIKSANVVIKSLASPQAKAGRTTRATTKPAPNGIAFMPGAISPISRRRFRRVNSSALRARSSIAKYRNRSRLRRSSTPSRRSTRRA
jgi:Sulfatase-modifying factor enzyme 1